MLRITRYWEKNVETVYIIWESGTSVGTLCEKDSTYHLFVSSKDLKRRNRFNYELLEFVLYLPLSRRNIGKAPISIFISLKNNLDKRARANDKWYTGVDMPNESQSHFNGKNMTDSDAKSKEEFWDHNMNIHPPVDHIAYTHC